MYLSDCWKLSALPVDYKPLWQNNSSLYVPPSYCKTMSLLLSNETKSYQFLCPYIRPVVFCSLVSQSFQFSIFKLIKTNRMQIDLLYFYTDKGVLNKLANSVTFFCPINTNENAMFSLQLLRYVKHCIY